MEKKKEIVFPLELGSDFNTNVYHQLSDIATDIASGQSDDSDELPTPFELVELERGENEELKEYAAVAIVKEVDPDKKNGYNTEDSRCLSPLHIKDGYVLIAVSKLARSAIRDILSYAKPSENAKLSENIVYTSPQMLKNLAKDA